MNIQSNSRRQFIKTIGTAGAGLVSISAIAKATEKTTPPRPTGATYLGGFVAPNLKTIKVAFIGCGCRGGTHYTHLSTFEGTEVVAVCDLYKDLCERAKKTVENNGKGLRHKNVKMYYGDPHAYKKMLKESKPDLVYIATPWEWHTPMAIDSMKSGAHACVEVPISTSIEETWQLIDVAEKTQKHCMMLENVCYGREELLFLNMCRKGIFGELMHGEAAYIHELRWQMPDVDRGRGTGFWRTNHWANEKGNLYPTHGLGPVAQYMNIARTDDLFRRIVSFSTEPMERKLWIGKHTKPNSKLRKMDFSKGGDLNTSIIKTLMGRTIMVQWTESSPRPYSRHNLIQGTRGTGKGFPFGVALDYEEKENILPQKLFKKLAGNQKHTNYHAWATDPQAFYDEFDHPLYKRMEQTAKKLGGHGGMDAIMNFRVVECIRKGQPLDQNLYEGCFWSSLTPLTRKSVAEDGMPQDFPDFTRGQWKTTKPLGIVE